MYIGIDIGGTTVKGIVTDDKGTMHGFINLPTWTRRQEIAPRLKELVAALAGSSPSVTKKLKAVGVGTAGSIDAERGIVLKSPNIPSLSGFPLSDTLSKITGKPVFIQNDATAAVMGELWLGHGTRYNTWLMLTLGTGIGGGVVIENRIYTGQAGSAMEVGHVSIDYKGRKCPCGSRGCLELYSSATALVAHTRRLLNRYPASSLHQRLLYEVLDARIIGEEARKGDTLSLLVYERISTWLGYGVANLVNLFNPEAVIFGGGLSKAHGLIFPVMKQTIHQRVLKGLDRNVKYLAIKDTTRGPSLGAAKIAIEALKGGRVWI